MGAGCGLGHVTCSPPKEGCQEVSLSLPPHCSSASWALEGGGLGPPEPLRLSLPCSSPLKPQEWQQDASPWRPLPS